MPTHEDVITAAARLCSTLYYRANARCVDCTRNTARTPGVAARWTRPCTHSPPPHRRKWAAATACWCHPRGTYSGKNAHYAGKRLSLLLSKTAFGYALTTYTPTPIAHIKSLRAVAASREDKLQSPTKFAGGGRARGRNNTGHTPRSKRRGLPLAQTHLLLPALTGRALLASRCCHCTTLCLSFAPGWRKSEKQATPPGEKTRAK